MDSHAEEEVILKLDSGYDLLMIPFDLALALGWVCLLYTVHACMHYYCTIKFIIYC